MCVYAYKYECINVAGVFYGWYTGLYCSRSSNEKRLWDGMWLVSFMHVNVGMLSNIGFSLPWCMYIIASKFHQVVGLSGHKLSPLKQGFGFKPCGWKKVIGRGDPTKGGQSSSPAEISHQQSWWILCTNVMMTKKNNIHVYLFIHFWWSYDNFQVSA